MVPGGIPMAPYPNAPTFAPTFGPAKVWTRQAKVLRRAGGSKAAKYGHSPLWKPGGLEETVTGGIRVVSAVIPAFSGWV